MNSFIVARMLPSRCSWKGTVHIGKAKIQPRRIICLEALFKKAMQFLLRVSPAGVKAPSVNRWLFFQCRRWACAGRAALHQRCVSRLWQQTCCFSNGPSPVRWFLLVKSPFQSFSEHGSSTTGRPCSIARWHCVLRAMRLSHVPVTRTWSSGWGRTDFVTVHVSQHRRTFLIAGCGSLQLSPFFLTSVGNEEVLQPPPLSQTP